MYRDIPSELRALIEPIVVDHGLELVDVTQSRGRAPWRVSVVVDTPAGDGRVEIDRCAALSREIGTVFDASDAIPVRYTLEVTSPGLDRVLAREKDFSAACGGEVRLETRQPVDGSRRFRGQLTRFQDGTLHLEVDGRPLAIPFADVARAQAVYEFTRADFARGQNEVKQR